MHSQDLGLIIPVITALSVNKKLGFEVRIKGKYQTEVLTVRTKPVMARSVHKRPMSDILP